MDTFEYQQLDLKTSAFRLVRLVQGTKDDEIECELIYTTLDENVISYEAVSYTWGTSDKTCVIHLEGRSFNVTSNLSSLLRNFRQTNVDRYLWIDAISINQDNKAERGHQVQRMQAIYCGAERVLFYLGEVSAEISLLMEFLTILQQETLGFHWAFDDPKWRTMWEFILYRDYKLVSVDTLRQGLEQLLSRPWFGRVWILQEVANARRALLCCGLASIPAQIFALSPTLLEVDLDSHSKTVFELMPAYSRGGSRKPRKLDLLSTLIKCYRLRVSDPRDRIFALLGLCANEKVNKSLKPDYTQGESAIVRNTIEYLLDQDLGPSTTCIEEFLGCLTFGTDHPISEYMEGVLIEMVNSSKIQVQFPLRKKEGIGFSLPLLDAAVSQGLNVEDWTSLLLQHGGRLNMSPRSHREFNNNYMSAYHCCFFKITERILLKSEGGMKNDELARQKKALQDEQRQLYHLLSHASQGCFEDPISKQRVANIIHRHQNPNELIGSYVVPERAVSRTILDINEVSHKAAVFAECALFTMAFVFQLGWNVRPHLNSRLKEVELHDISIAMALYIAVSRRYLPTVRRLLSEGAKIVIGRLPNPLSYAVYTQDHDMMEILSEYRANIVGYDGRPPLNCAAEFETASVVRFLLDQGADVTLVENYGLTACDVATSLKRFDIAALLEAAEHGKLDQFDQEAVEKRGACDAVDILIYKVLPDLLKYDAGRFDEGWEIKEEMKEEAEEKTEGEGGGFWNWLMRRGRRQRKEERGEGRKKDKKGKRKARNSDFPRWPFRTIRINS
ncbi:heterokaryon incompatibility protein-domain-containing protein [Nemania diffusa]|nr:heterokaryon incompatibility protein-domain-containing protein [Nemania diffusa]